MAEVSIAAAAKDLVALKTHAPILFIIDIFRNNRRFEKGPAAPRLAVFVL